MNLFIQSLNSAQYQKIFLYVESESETIQDSIVVFTRDVYPITNFSAIAMLMIGLPIRMDSIC